MDQHLDLFAALAAPFSHEEVRMRPQGNRQIQYITARTVMNRLDEVLGPASWWDDYVPQENSVICRLTIRLPDGATLTKCDAGGYAGMSDSGDDDKSGFSDAFKRAAVKFGIGRYLYRDGVPRFVSEQFRQTDQETKREPSPRTQAHPEHVASTISEGTDGHGLPQTGKALFAWVKHQDETHGLGLFKHLNEWATRHEFPARMVQWNAEQVQRAVAESQKLLNTASREPKQSPSNGATRSEATRTAETTSRPKARAAR